MLILLHALLTSFIAAQAEFQLIYNCVDMPYYMEKHDQNDYRGVLVDAFKMAAKEAGFHRTQIQMLPPNRMVQNLIEGKGHVWNGVVLPALREHVHIGTVKLTPITLAVFSHFDSVEKLKFPEDFQNKGLIIIRGYSYGGYLDFLKKKKLNLTFHETRNHESALKMMQANRAQFLLNYIEPVEAITKNSSFDKLYLNKINSIETFFMVSKKLPDGDIILKKLEAGYLKNKKAQKTGPN